MRMYVLTTFFKVVNEVLVSTTEIGKNEAKPFIIFVLKNNWGLQSATTNNWINKVAGNQHQFYVNKSICAIYKIKM